MIINGLSPGTNYLEEVEASKAEKEKIQNEIAQKQQEIKNAKIKEEFEKQKNKEEKEDYSRFVMNDYHLKELLLLFSSKGNAQSVEELAKLLKKEKELRENSK